MKYLLFLLPLSMSTLIACPRCDKTKEFIEYSLDSLYQLQKIYENNPDLVQEDICFVEGRILTFKQIISVMEES